MRLPLRRTATAIACATGLDHVARRLNRRRLLILCYHGVTAEPVPRSCPEWHHVPAAEFERQIAFLRRHYHIAPLDPAIRDLRSGSLDGPTVCLTFDDGYRNNLTVALPILRKLNAPATIFLTTDLIGTDRTLWTVEVESRIRSTSRDTIDLRPLGLGVREVGSRAQRVAAAADVLALMKTLPPGRRAEMLTSIHDELPSPPPCAGGPFRLMSWEDVEAAADTGLITFGAHTANHEIMANLDDRALETETAGSVAAVRKRTAAASMTFAYPNGRREDFDGRSKAAVRKAGLTAALSTLGGINSASTDPFELRRVVVGAHMGFGAFRLAAAGVTAVVHTLRPGT